MQLKTTYRALLTDLEALGLSLDLETIKIGTLGHFTNQSTASLHALLPNLQRGQVCRLLLDLRKIAVSCSALISNARHSAMWTSPLYTNMPLSLPKLIAS